MKKTYENNYPPRPKRQWKFKLAGKIDQFLDKEGIHYKTSSTGEIIIESCPSCGKENKLYVSEETGVAQCKSASCDFAMGIAPAKLFAALLDVDDRTAFKTVFEEVLPKKKVVNLWSDEEEVEEVEEEPQYKPKKKIEVPDAKLPEMAVDLDKTLHPAAWNYLTGRGYTDEIITKLNLKIVPYYDYKQLWAELLKKGYAQDRIKYHLRYMNRVIFPLYIEGVIKGFIARSFIPVEDSMKVMNSEGNFRSQYYWNYDNTKESETLIICEGISDAVKCGINEAVALLGTAAAEGQLELIKKTKAKKIILALDVGTEKNQLYIYERLASAFPGEIFALQLPRLLTQKEDLLNPAIKNALEELCNDDISYFNSKELHLPYYVYLDVKRKLKQNWFSSLKEEDQARLKTFIEKAKYKDAGDYTFAEMAEFARKAVKVNKEFFENELSYYADRNLPGFVGTSPFKS